MKRRILVGAGVFGVFYGLTLPIAAYLDAINWTPQPEVAFLAGAIHASLFFGLDQIATAIWCRP